MTWIWWLAGVPGPAALLGVSVTVYVPGDENVWLGFLRIEVLLLPDPGSPKSQVQAVGLLVDWSVNATVSGAPPDVGDGAESSHRRLRWWRRAGEGDDELRRIRRRLATRDDQAVGPAPLDPEGHQGAGRDRAHRQVDVDVGVAVGAVALTNADPMIGGALLKLMPVSVHVVLSTL